MKVAFLDRDGTLILEPENTKQVDSVDQLMILPGVIQGLQNLQDAGFALVLVSNQDGMGTPAFPEESFKIPQAEFLHLLRGQGIVFDAIFICSHFLGDECDCRKPKTGLVREFLCERGVNFSESLMIGDRPTDREFALNIGVKFIEMQTNGSFPMLRHA